MNQRILQALHFKRTSVLLLMFFSCLFSLKSNAQQNSQWDAFQQKVQEAQMNGTYEPPSCGLRGDIFAQGNDRTINCNISTGYGTEGLVNNDATANANANDPACPIYVPACSATKYQVPIAITIFECASWSNENYTDFPGQNSMEFEALTDPDVNTMLADMNAVYANLNIEFYEAHARQRIEDCDLYDMYYGGTPDPTGDGINDGIDDLDETIAFDRPDVVNIYYAGGLNGDHDCCGVTGAAPYPPSRDYFYMAYRANFGSTPAHELGHYFGIAHTHDGSAGGVPATALDNSDCASTGDGICDTWPDPDFSNCRNSSCVYQEGGALCPELTIDPASGVDQGGGKSTVLQSNIMSYNSFSGCRTTFSPCQMSKIQDVLQGCRNNLGGTCSYTFADFFASEDDTQIEICTGDAIPDFSAIAGGCYLWYANATDGVKDAPFEGVVFNAGTDGGVDNNTAGVYTFYIGEANEYRSGTDCRIPVTLTILEGVGAGSPASVEIADLATTYNFTGPTAALGSSDFLGWYFTDADPTGNSLSGTTMSGTTISAFNQLIQSNSGVSDLNGINVDCIGLGGDGIYYLTPFVALGEAPVVCSVSATSSPVTWGFSPPRGGAVTGATGPITGCDSGGLTDFTYEIVVAVTSCDQAGDVFRLNLRSSASSCNSISLGGPPLPTIVCGVGNTHTYSQADIEAAIPGFDPFTSDFCVSSYNDGSGDLDQLTYTITLNVTYTGDSGEEVWNANGTPSVTGNLSCLFGTPIIIDCLGALPVELSSFTGRAQAKTVVLNWRTETELNNDYFILERSNDGRNYEPLAEVKGSGTIGSSVEYSYTDLKPFEGFNYYRLIQVDYDGSKHYQREKVVVEFLNASILSVNPNPVVDDFVTVNYHTASSGDCQLSIYNLDGQLVSETIVTAQKGPNRFSLKLPNLTSGVYVVQVRRQNDIQIVRFVRSY